MTEDTDILQYAGTRANVWLVQLPDGSVPARDFLEALGARERAAFKAMFVQLGDHGPIHNKERFRAIKDSDRVWEFKVNSGQGWRMWGKFGNGGMFVTHGAAKPKSNKLKRETDKAEEYFLQRRSAK